MTADLIKRLEKADWPRRMDSRDWKKARNLDLEIWFRTSGATRVVDEKTGEVKAHWGERFEGDTETVWTVYEVTEGTPWGFKTDIGSDRDLPEYTTSLDAITALIEERLPGWTAIELQIFRDEVPTDDFWASAGIDVCGEMKALVHGKTPALTLCIALLHALAQEGET